MSSFFVSSAAIYSGHEFPVKARRRRSIVGDFCDFIFSCNVIRRILYNAAVRKAPATTAKDLPDAFNSKQFLNTHTVIGSAAFVTNSRSVGIESIYFHID